jgi:Cell division protein FtsI/penicillin-binding protein 2
MYKMGEPSISQKTNFVLRAILVALFLILFRIWHLGVIQRDEKLLSAQNSQKKTHLIRANRGTICDRYLTPLAFNRICYNAAIYYNQISQMPMSSWRVDEAGVKKKVFPRKEYIKALAGLLARELGLDERRVEDEIHSKASLFPHAPYIIKGDLTEKQHSRLCQLERDWPGLHAETASERFYPLGKVGADLIGTMGSISAKEYHAIAEEMNTLQAAALRFEQGFWEDLPRGYDRIEEVYRRLHELKEKAYTFNDRVGKTGIEAQFEQQLRGYFGKKSIEVDQKGRFVRDLPTSYPSIAGRQVVLSISAELQQFAEQLLIQDDKARDGRSLGLDPQVNKRKRLKQPWIKGGAIVAMDPHTGEILAMAGYPRFNPNDFILSGPEKAKKAKQVQRWLENEQFMADVWDGKEPLIRERFGRNLYEEAFFLTWEHYLQSILALEGPLWDFFHRFDTIKAAIELQEDAELALYHAQVSDPIKLFDQLAELLAELQTIDPKTFSKIKKLESALQPLSSPSDKLFALDILRLAVHSAAFSDELIRHVGSMKLSTYFSLHQALEACEALAQEIAKKQFHEGPFEIWREAHQKEFLAKKEKRKKREKLMRALI